MKGIADAICDHRGYLLRRSIAIAVS